jgi:aspartate aminotransferase
MPESPIRKLAPYAQSAKDKGIKVYHLNIGQPDIKSPKTAVEAVKNMNLDIFEYAPSAGYLYYRKTLCQYYHSLGFTDLTPDNFLVTNGGSEALQFTLSCICDEGDEILLPEPFYANYYGFAQSLGVKIQPLVSGIEDGFALPDLSKYEELITPKTKAILITNPGNPTGYLYSRKELEDLCKIVLKHDIFVIVDEVYREYVYDGEKHHSILEFSELKDHAIVIDSESKRYSMTGIRCGFLVTRSSTFIDTALKFAQARLSPVLLGQIAANAAHSEPQSYIDGVRKEYTERRDLLIKLLNEIPDVVCPKPKGAFYCMAELPVENAEDFCLWLLKDFDYQGTTVMLAPAEGFYSNHELGRRQVRIAYVLKKEDLTKSVEILKKALEEYKKVELS